MPLGKSASVEKIPVLGFFPIENYSIGCEVLLPEHASKQQG